MKKFNRNNSREQVDFFNILLMAYRVNCPKIVNQEQKYVVGQEVVGKGKKE